MSMTRKNFISGIILLIFAIILFATSFSIQFSSAEPLGPAFFPRVVAALIGLLSIGLIYRSAKEQKEEKSSSKINKEEVEKLNFKLNIPLILNSILVIAYALLINSLGFIITSIVYLFCQIRLISAKEQLTKKYLIVQVIVSLLVPIILYYGFAWGFDVYLPAGILG